ncbi:MAG: carboxypeptidase M32 [Oscillospiraceae bacterium]|nr:carboxypeptidase M32 [Oscillospiraceae bacterium]
MADIKENLEKLASLQRKISAYAHATALLYFDGNTGAPSKTTENRAISSSILSEELYRLQTSDETFALLEELDAHRDELPESERRQVYLILKELRETRCIPMDEYIALQKLLIESDSVWHEAKERSDFAMFLPYLEKIFEAYKKVAGYAAPDKDPYDYWLSRYEDGLNRETCDKFFSRLREGIVPLLARVMEASGGRVKGMEGYYPVSAQEKLSDYLMDVLLLDRGHCGISTTEHPYTINFGSHLDVRITTNYHENDFIPSMFSVIHEGGHALYETNIDDAYTRTAIDSGVSMGIHESQSRFYENIIARSKGFTSFLFPKLREIFPEALKDATEEDFYLACNTVVPGLIRIDADELTYCLHIMVRYELEKRIMAGELKVSELPSEWNRLYKEYLGVDVPDDKHGVLQDSHWANGNIGYFPSYALGSAYGAQLLSVMKKELDVDACTASGRLEPVNAWLKEHIWRHGSLIAPGELLRRACGEEFNPDYYVNYLSEKYSSVYGLK